MESQDPYVIFDAWFKEARESELNDGNAMALATADANGHPSVRMVLLKGHGPDADGKGGFIFYTNLESRKVANWPQTPMSPCCSIGSLSAARSVSKAR
jgi:pyridoxamine 5'-phosphate oxidase